MRIIVNDIAASEGGALTVLESFHEYVRDHDEKNEWVFLLGSRLLEESGRIRTVTLPRVKSSWLRRLAFDLFTGRRLIRALRPDVVLSLQNTYTYGVSCPQVVYVHQAIPFQTVKSFSLRRRGERVLAIYQHVVGAVIKRSIRSADHVIVQAHWMKAAILRHSLAPDGHISVVPPDFDGLGAFGAGGPRDPRDFFYPTSDQSYKNNECIYTACRVLRDQGVTDFTVALTVDATRPAPNVIGLGHIPREEVLERLSRAALIFPSLIETFGLPLAEARALGSLVLAADLPYAREVLDGYDNAYYFDPSSPSELAALMGRVLSGDIVTPQVNHNAEMPRSVTEPVAWQRTVEILVECRERWPMKTV